MSLSSGCACCAGSRILPNALLSRMCPGLLQVSPVCQLSRWCSGFVVAGPDSGVCGYPSAVVQVNFPGIVPGDVPFCRWVNSILQCLQVRGLKGEKGRHYAGWGPGNWTRRVRGGGISIRCPDSDTNVDPVLNNPSLLVGGHAPV